MCALLLVALMLPRSHPLSVKTGGYVSAHSAAHHERTHTHAGPEVGTRDRPSCVLHGIPSQAHTTPLFGVI
jgi:hypothetical protein